MTDQAIEGLHWNGERHPLLTTPLDPVLEASGVSFHSPHTALFRGYLGEWRIEGDSLYLTGVEGYLLNRTKVGIDYLFPGQTPPIRADWFTGVLAIPTDERNKMLQMLWGTEFVETTLIHIDSGRVTGIEIRAPRPLLGRQETGQGD